MLSADIQELNPDAARLEADPVELSRLILTEARTLRDPCQCRRIESLAGQLHEVDPTAIERDGARLAFWINLYNAILLHRLCREPVRGSILLHPRMFSAVAYRVGGQPYTLNVIEHGVLRRNRRPPLGLRRPLRRGDPRIDAAPPELDPRVHFALNCGARSCPPVREYDAERAQALLEEATLAYLEAESDLDPARRRIRLPRLMRIYRADFGPRRAQVEFAARYLPALAEWPLADGVHVGYGRFDWTAGSARRGAEPNLRRPGSEPM